MNFFSKKVSSASARKSYRLEAALFDSVVANQFVSDFAGLTQPDRIELVTGTRGNYDKLIDESVKEGELIALDQDKWPGCYYARSLANDVARVETKTIIATKHEDDAGPKVHWKNPKTFRRELNHIAHDSMKGRTLYVVPFSMGPVDSSFSIIGIQLTDSRYVAENMIIMTRTGEEVIKKINDGHNFVRCMHAKADLDPDKRWIAHFPDKSSPEIYSVGSNYGGNALLGKKCLALRIAGVMGRDRGWMAEHMLIMGVTDPKGETKYVTAAFPSACGKTNFAMMQLPKYYSDQGYKVETVGDDIAWLFVDKYGHLRAINPENGFFGVAPGTSDKTNPNMMKAIKHDTLFTNVAIYKNEKGNWEPWWEGLTDTPPAGLIDWQGNPYDPASGKPAAHPNSRFTTPAKNSSVLSDKFDSPEGVPISAMFFGGRRAKVTPLITEAFDWNHGVYMAATMASETTAAAVGAVGETRHDPMAMLPFFGYNPGDYFRHWFDMGKKIEKHPKFFSVNWFRKDENGKFIWPGYGDNAYPLMWALDRVDGKVNAVETVLGLKPESLPTPGLPISEEQKKKNFDLDLDLIEKDHEDISNKLFADIGDHLPIRMQRQHKEKEKRIKAAKENNI